jgi:DNA gyrase subunit A
MEKFKLSPLQAQAILEMQLQRLTNLEREKIVQEYQEVKALIAKLRKILSSDKMVMDIIGGELREVKASFGDARRTELRDEGVTDIRPEDLIKEEDVVVLFTQSGYVKRTSLSSYHFQMRGGKGRKGISMKAEDVVENLSICSTHSYLMFFTNIGRVYWLKALEIPDVGIAGRGKAIANLIEFQPDERVTSVVAVKEFTEDRFIVMMTTDGQIKKTSLSEFQNIRKGGIIAIGLKPKAQLMWTRLTDGKREIVIATKLGKAIRFSEKDPAPRPPGRGPPRPPACGGCLWEKRTRSSAWWPSATVTNSSSRSARRATARRPRRPPTASSGAAARASSTSRLRPRSAAPWASWGWGRTIC